MKKVFFLVFGLGAIASIIYYFSGQASYEEKMQTYRLNYQKNLSSEDPPLIHNDAQLSFYAVDKNWLLEASIEVYPQPQDYKLSMTDTTQETAKVYGKISFNKDGKNHSLLVFDEGENLNIPFKDLSNGTETYGGGRYINIAKADIASSSLKLDFNKAANFYCAYQETYICPVPPKENQLTLSIPAGEKTFSHQH
jgi:uncharacterized protein